MNRTATIWRPRFTISFLLLVTLLAACGAFLGPQLYRQRMTDNSNAAEENLSRFYLNLDEYHYSGAAESIQRDGTLVPHLDSCGPNVDLSSLRINDFDQWIPLLQLIVAEKNKSHVGIFVSSHLMGDVQFVSKLEEELPGCAFFDRSTLVGAHALGGRAALPKTTEQPDEREPE